MSAAILSRLFDAVFDQPVMQNNLRALYAEFMVECLLGKGWVWDGRDWGGWDVVGPGGVKLEVKQSAARQSWHRENQLRKPAAPAFDIAERTGRWDDGDRWIEGKCRPADIYVFAWHPVEDTSCDHRNPGQWRFFVVATSDLPNQKSIGLSSLRGIAEEIGADELRKVVGRALSSRS